MKEYLSTEKNRKMEGLTKKPFYITCGVHGDEADTIQSVLLEENYRNYDYNIRIMNPNAYLRGVRSYPQGKNDLNRPIIQDVKVQKMKQWWLKRIACSNPKPFWIDLHQDTATNVPYVCMIDFDQESTQNKIKIAKKLGINKIVIVSPEVGARNLNLQYSLKNGYGEFEGNTKADGLVIEFPANSPHVIREFLHKIRELENNISTENNKDQQLAINYVEMVEKVDPNENTNSYVRVNLYDDGSDPAIYHIKPISYHLWE